jgi:hypothetical protein
MDDGDTGWMVGTLDGLWGHWMDGGGGLIPMFIQKQGQSWQSQLRPIGHLPCLIPFQKV